MVAIDLFSSAEKGGFSRLVLLGGSRLELTVSFPGQLVDTKAFRVKRLLDFAFIYEVHHPELAGFCKSLKMKLANSSA